MVIELCGNPARWRYSIDFNCSKKQQRMRAVRRLRILCLGELGEWCVLSVRQTCHGGAMILRELAVRLYLFPPDLRATNRVRG